MCQGHGPDRTAGEKLNDPQRKHDGDLAWTYRGAKEVKDEADTFALAFDEEIKETRMQKILKFVGIEYTYRRKISFRWRLILWISDILLLIEQPVIILTFGYLDACWSVIWTDFWDDGDNEIY